MDETVSSRAFGAAVVALLKFHRSHLDMVTALVHALQEKNILQEGEWQEALQWAKETPSSRDAWMRLEDLDKSLESISIADMLRDFSGPIQ